MARALLELAAVERESDGTTSAAETLIDRRNCEKELGITPRAFVDAAGRDFASFRVSRRLTATKAEVLAWMKTRTVEAKPPRPLEAPKPPDPEAFLKAANARFMGRVGRPMSDQELSDAEMWIDVGRSTAMHTRDSCSDTPDDIAARIERKLSEEPFRHGRWRSYGLDPGDMDRRASDLRQRLYADHPDWDWRQRQQAVEEMWGAITRPLSEARRTARAEKRAAKKAERAKAGQLGLRK